MEIHWLNPDAEAETLILAGDVGGTNTSLALAGKRNNGFFIFAKFLFRTREVDSLGEAARAAMAEIRRRLPTARIDRCCVSAAGPVRDNVCTMTNAPWDIRGDDLAAILGIPALIINDFTAVGYGLPFLDTDDPSEVTRIPRPDGSFPRPSGSVRAVVGAGTGLGVGCIIESGGAYTSVASEGGHIDFGGFDEESRELCRWVENRIGTVAEAELFVSGRGLVNIFHFYREKAGPSAAAIFHAVTGYPDAEKPARISAAAEYDPDCARIMRLFTRLYGRVAANVAVTFLPGAGLFLAGGIAAKNEGWFLRDGGFMETFSMGYRRVIREALLEIPVYIIKDYGISLLGAAHAACALMPK